MHHIRCITLLSLADVDLYPPAMQWFPDVQTLVPQWIVMGIFCASGGGDNRGPRSNSDECASAKVVAALAKVLSRDDSYFQGARIGSA